MLISNETSEALDILVGKMFDLNRSFDRAVSWMQNVWSMPQASDIVHHKLAHLFPLLADLLTEIKDRYNVPSVYPETHRDGREYQNLLGMFETLLKECSDGYEMIVRVEDIAISHKDKNVLADMVNFMQKYNELMGQVITLRDKAEQLPTSYDEFDRHIKSWGIKGVSL